MCLGSPDLSRLTQAYRSHNRLEMHYINTSRISNSKIDNMTCWPGHLDDNLGIGAHQTTVVVPTLSRFHATRIVAVHRDELIHASRTYKTGKWFLMGQDSLLSLSKEWWTCRSCSLFSSTWSKRIMSRVRFYETCGASSYSCWKPKDLVSRMEGIPNNSESSRDLRCLDESKSRPNRD